MYLVSSSAALLLICIGNQSVIGAISALKWQLTQAPARVDSSDVCDGDLRMWLGSVWVYSSSLSYSGAVCWAGPSTVRVGTWLREDSSFSVLEAGGAVFMGGAVRAAVETERQADEFKFIFTDQLHMYSFLIVIWQIPVVVI